MNPIRHRILMLAAGLALSGASASGDEAVTPEPLELTRLRQQFQHRLDQELVPWREKYRKELQKLEDRMIAERKLVEALAVKKEREANAPLSTEPAADGGASKVPGTVSEAREMLAGTVWLVYLKEDRKRETPADVYQFLDAGAVFVFSQKRSFKWSLPSANELSIEFLAGKIEAKLDFEKLSADSSYLTTEYVMVHTGRPKTSSK